jgi:hypothetical protein
VNPADAVYCYYDGRALAQADQEPLGIGTLTFPSPFRFSDGKSCANFNQLALACDGRWSDARRLLGDGGWQSFFASIGRMDLALLASQAAREADLDVGLTYFLERWPVDPEALRPPRLTLQGTTNDLGTLEAGKDHKFDLVIGNQGMLLLRGTVMTDSDWLCFGERQGSFSTKLFQTRDSYPLTVRVLGQQLRAGLTPLEARIVIDTNGGREEMTVRATVPIRPFPKGQVPNNVLAGARSPREVALRAKAHPQEAAGLFEQGLVKAWYHSNGWTYPIQGTQGKGKGVIQQFFEALGLTKPPRLEINPDRIVCEGTPGEPLTRKVTISSPEAKFVTAGASSDQEWITIQPDTSQGNKVTIPLRIDVPPRPGETLHASVTFQGNGQQQFVVPVTLTVGADTSGAARGSTRQRLVWLCSGVALLLVSAGVIAVVAGRQGNDTVDPPPVVIGPPPPPPQVKAWWDALSDHTLAASAAKLKEAAPAHQAIFEALAVPSDVARHKAYEQLAARLPELVRIPNASQPLGQFVTACCVHEPSDLNIGPLQRALASQFPADGQAFVPEEKGEDVERAFFWLQVVFDAITHPAVRPARSRSLANDLGTVFGFSLDTSVSANQLKEQAEKLLAVRCFRNTLPTAARSIEEALDIRNVLLTRFPQHFSADFRDQVDVDLLASGLTSGTDLWPKLEPIFKSCVESNHLNVSLKLLALYERANANLAPKMEDFLVLKWKTAANTKLTHAAKVMAIRKSLIVDPNTARITRAERVGQLQKLVDSRLSAVQPGEKQDVILLQDTLRLAHASTMGCILFDKDADLERFDGLIGKCPGLEQAPLANKEEKPRLAKGVIDVGFEPWSTEDALTDTSDRDKRGGRRKTYSVSMQAGRVYTIDMRSTDLNSYLRLESPAGVQVAADDDGGGFPNARIVYTPKADGVYCVTATTSGKDGVGAFTLQIQQGGGFGGFGGFGFGVPARIGIGFQPNPFLMPAMPVFPMEDPKNPKREVQVNPADLADLTSKQAAVRITAFNNLAGSVPNDLAFPHAQKIARYLLLSIAQDAELEAITPKLASLDKCLNLLEALADVIANETVPPQRAEVIVGGVLRQQVRFAKDEDWRSACRKLLLQRTLELTTPTANTANRVAEFLRDMYKEQGLALGLEDQAFLTQTQLTRVLEGLIKHLADKTAQRNPPPAEKDYLDRIRRQLLAARYGAANDLEYAVLLQRIWLKVLTLYLQDQATNQAKAMLDLRLDLDAQDRGSRSVLHQLRSGEEMILRVWALAHNLK